MKLIFFVLASLGLGSFANVCIYRWPRGQSIMFPSRSHCPWCAHQIHWYENFPVLSFLFLRGRCAHCGSHISWRYPFIELVLPIIFGTAWYVMATNELASSPPFLIGIVVFCFLLLVAFFTDLDWKIIPDEVTISLLVIALAVSSWNPLLGQITVGQSLLNAIKGAVAGAFPLWLIGQAGKKILGKEAMGGGDIKLMMGIGGMLGWQSSIAVLMLASFLAALSALIGIAFRLLKRGQYIAFGPFITVAAFAEFFLRCKNFSFCDILKKIP